MDFTLVVSHAQDTLKLYLSTDRLQNLLRKRCQYLVSLVNPPQSRPKASVLEHQPDRWSPLQNLNLAHVTQNFDLSDVSAAMHQDAKTRHTYGPYSRIQTQVRHLQTAKNFPTSHRSRAI